MNHLDHCPSSSPDPLAADCECTRLRACQEAMRAACISTVINYLNEIPTETQMDEWVEKYGTKWFQDALVAALREVQP
jgi:arsenate reductase-like glutaredoxin family protein